MPLVQHASNSAATPSSLTASFGANATAGNLLVAAILYDGGNSISSVKDGNGNSLALAVATPGGETVLSVAIYYSQNCAGGSKDITVTFSGAQADTAIGTMEFSSAATSGGADQTNVTARTTSANVSSGNVTTVASGEFLIGVFASQAVSTITEESGWTSVYNGPSVAGSIGGGVECFIGGAAGSVAATWTLNTSVIWRAAIATFEASSGGATAAYPLFRAANLVTGGGGRCFVNPLN